MDNTNALWNFHKCPFCRYKTKRLLNIVSHVRKHRIRSKNHRFTCIVDRPENYECQRCHLQVHLKVLLTKHYDTVHRSKETRHYPTPELRHCENCDFQTYSSLVLLNHNNFCDRNGNTTLKHIRLFKCQHCSYEGKSESDLSAHLCGTVHNVVTSLPAIPAKDENNLLEPVEKKRARVSKKKIPHLQCAHCSYKTERCDRLRNHLLVNHTPSEKINWIKCDLCSYKTIRQGDFKAHLLNKHTPTEQINWIRCEQCSFRTKRKWNLKQHVFYLHKETVARAVAPKKLKYFKKCDQCCYETVRNARLREHIILKHTPSEQIDWFNCKHCSYKTKLKRSLDKHVRTLHLKTVKAEKA